VCNCGSFWRCFVDWNCVYEIEFLYASDLVWFCFECVNLEFFFLLSLEASSVWGRRIVFDSWSVFVFLRIGVHLTRKHGHDTDTGNYLEKNEFIECNYMLCWCQTPETALIRSVVDIVYLRKINFGFLCFRWMKKSGWVISIVFLRDIVYIGTLKIL